MDGGFNFDNVSNLTRLSWSQNTDCLVSLPRQNRILSSWVIKKRFITKKTQIDTFKITIPIPSFHQIIMANCIAWCLQQLALILSHQIREKNRHDTTQTTWTAVSHCEQNPFNSLMTAGHSSNTSNIYHCWGCQKVTESSNITVITYATSRRWLPTENHHCEEDGHTVWCGYVFKKYIHTHNTVIGYFH